MANQSSIRGAIKVAGVPDSACFTTFAELLRALEQYLIVDISEQTLSNIIISNQQPGQADRDKIWARLSNAGIFLGFYIFENGMWVQILPAPNQIFWLYGDSNNPPAGYQFLDSSQTIFTAPQYAELIALAVPNGGVPPFVYYPAIYTGL